MNIPELDLAALIDVSIGDCEASGYPVLPDVIAASMCNYFFKSDPPEVRRAQFRDVFLVVLNRLAVRRPASEIVN
jgi:hypothetical protein